MSMIKKLFNKVLNMTNARRIMALEKNVENLALENNSMKVILRVGLYRDESWIVQQLHKQMNSFMDACGLSEIDVWPPLFNRFASIYSFTFSSDNYNEMIAEIVVANKLYDLFKIAFDMYPVQFYTAEYL